MLRRAPHPFLLLGGLVLVAVAVSVLVRSASSLVVDARFIVPALLVAVGALGVSQSWTRARRHREDRSSDDLW
ncbi:MAG: hypothetical protein ACRDZQ_08905 [Acidimicrobiales bacterium]